MFAQLNKKDVISLNAELQVIAEEVLAANAIVIGVATEDALNRTKNWNTEFKANFKEIYEPVFKYIAPPTPMIYRLNQVVSRKKMTRKIAIVPDISLSLFA